MSKSGWRRATKQCSVCRGHFIPNARVGDRQRTCGEPCCRREQKRRTQAQWSKRHRSYWTERRLQDQVTKLQEPTNDVRVTGPPAELAKVPVDWAQDAMGAKALVIILFLARVLHRAAQDAMRQQRAEIKEEIRKVQEHRAQDAIGPEGPDG